MVMAVPVNPYEDLVKMLRQRRKRQSEALADTDSQLEGAHKAYVEWSQAKLPVENKK